VSMCMRCGLRKPPRRGEVGCTCREEREACERSGEHGREVKERQDAIFPDYVHRTCLRCGHIVKERGET